MKKTRSNSKGLRIACAIMAVLILAIITLGVLQFATPYKPFPKKWFGQNGGDEESQKDLTSGVVVTPEENTGIALTTERTETDGWITVTATVLLENGSPAPESRNGVTFGFRWTREHAEPLEQYIVWTTNGNTVSLKCKQAFDTQILLTITSKADPSKSTTAKVDYACREYEIEVFPVVEEGEGSGKTYLTMNDAGTPYYEVSYDYYSGGVRWIHGLAPNDLSGTIPNELESITVTVEASPELVEQLHRSGALSEGKHTSVYTMEIAGSSIERLDNDKFQISDSANTAFQDLEFINLMTDNDSTEGIDGDYYEKFQRAVLDCSFNHDINLGCDFWVKITAHWKYGGDRDYRYNIDFADKTPIGSVVPDKPSIIF